MCQFIKKKNLTKRLLITLMFICFCTIPAIAQTQDIELSKEVWLFIIGFGILIILSIVTNIISSRKSKMRSKKYQRVFVDIFTNLGFSATDIICTNCRYKVRQDKAVQNIALGVKNEILSFFGGGTWPLEFNTNGKRVTFTSKGAPISKKLKGDYDLLLYDEETVKCLFPKNDKYKFRHLIDIPIKNIETVNVIKQGNVIGLIIQCSDNLIKLSSSCYNEETEIETLKTIADVFSKIKTNGTLSKAEIYETNVKISDIIGKDNRIEGKKVLKTLKTIGKVVTVGTSIVIASAVSGACNYDKDRVLSQID